MVRRVRLSNIMEIRKDENPDLDSHRLKTRFTYPNPKWAENERLGFSNFGVPGEICLVQEQEDRFTLPRGLVHHIFHPRVGNHRPDEHERPTAAGVTDSPQALPEGAVRDLPQEESRSIGDASREWKDGYRDRDHFAEEAEIPGDCAPLKTYSSSGLIGSETFTGVTARSHRCRAVRQQDPIVVGIVSKPEPPA